MCSKKRKRKSLPHIFTTHCYLHTLECVCVNAVRWARSCAFFFFAVSKEALFFFCSPHVCVNAPSWGEQGVAHLFLLYTYLYYTLLIVTAQVRTLECACISPFMRWARSCASFLLQIWSRVCKHRSFLLDSIRCFKVLKVRYFGTSEQRRTRECRG
jgi:hypothetical protein